MQDILLVALRLAGVGQVLLVVANVHGARVLGYARNLEGTDRIFRHVFWAHTGWIAATLLLLAGLDLAFPDVLAGAHPVGTYVSAWIAVAWGARFVLQVSVYDRAFLRTHLAAHRMFSTAFLCLALVHAAAAFAPLLGDGGR
jgi:hypothetical protein